MPEARKLIGQSLIERGIITPEQLDEALETQESEPTPRKVGEILIDKGYLNDSELADALGAQLGIRVLDIERVEIPDTVIRLLPRTIARRHEVIPVSKSDNTVTVVMSNPLDFDALDSLRFILNSDIDVTLAGRGSIRRALDRYYKSVGEGADAALAEFEAGAPGAGGEPTDDTGVAEAEAGDAPVIRLVHMLIVNAFKARASDIHIEPMETRMRVRYRIDGVCQEIDAPPKRLQNAITSRIKIMAKMNIAEKRRPQDGRILLHVGAKQIDLRVSVLPATHGESIVLRILEKESMLMGLPKLGFHEDDLRRFERIIRRPNGIFLVTGPTGSGKTTTLYAALNTLNRSDTKILSVEDPVEYMLSGVNQVQVNENMEPPLTFARVLRSMLRQSPDVILVGEIRDSETAEVAIQAALTGHLVFSTLHTNDAPSAVTRLIDIGVKPFLVASSIQAVMAQRLVRVLCSNCKEPYEPDDKELLAARLRQEDLEGVTFYRGRGCPQCFQNGYRGRIGIFELMEMNNTLREMAFRKETYTRLRAQARRSGMLTLEEDGVRKAIAGITTLDEVIRITQREEEFAYA